MAELITAAQLAARLNVAADTIGQWRRRGIIPFVQINQTTIRYDADEVIDALKARQVTTEAADA